MRRTVPVVAALIISTVMVLAQPKMVTTPSGLKYTDTKAGTGVAALSGVTAEVKYTGWLYVDSKRGKEFDKGTIKVKIGAHEVIPGWEEGLQGMKVGGVRELIIPPALGYGARGAGGVIPPNATLDFEVELLGVSK